MWLLYPSFAVVLAAVGLMLDADAVVVAVVLAIVPSYNPSFALAVVGWMWDAVALAVAVVR